MRLEIDPQLYRDLAVYADMRNTSTPELIIDILSYEMMIKKHLTKEDEKTIMDIFKKYLP